MPAHVQLVMGPAGAGKSTYCHAIHDHAAITKRKIVVANLDPATDTISYRVAFDIRELISLSDVMEELDLGPNGGLLYCMEYLLENSNWLRNEIEKFHDDELILLDCPGQIELYSHVPVMRALVEIIQSWGVRVGGIYLIDATFVADPSKFIAGSLLSLSAMVQLELPHLNILSKCDMINEKELEFALSRDTATVVLKPSLNADPREFAKITSIDMDQVGQDHSSLSSSGLGHSRLTRAISDLLDDFSMVSFIPLNLNDECCVDLVLRAVEQLTQFGEDLDSQGGAF